MHGDDNVWSTDLRLEIAKELMQMLSLKRAIDQPSMAKCVCWNRHALSREECNVLLRTLNYQVEGQRKNNCARKISKRRVGEERRRAHHGWFK